MILIIAASDGQNLELSRQLSNVSKELNIPHQLVQLSALDLPLYCVAAELKGIPEKAKWLQSKMSEAQGFILVAPEYNGSLPPLLNNSIAWVSRCGSENWRAAFAKKFAALATHSGGGGAKVLAAMRVQLEHLGCNILARQILTTPSVPLKLESAKDVLLELAKYCKV